MMENRKTVKQRTRRSRKQNRKKSNQIVHKKNANLEFLVRARRILVHRHGASDVTQPVGVAVEQQEGPADGRDLLLDARHRPHQLHAERHPHAAVVVQLVVVVRLHLEVRRGSVRKRLRPQIVTRSRICF